MGGASTGALQQNQLEFSSSFQYINSDKFFFKDDPASEAIQTFDSFKSLYQYFKVGYGLSRNLSFSLETGYYFQKKETGLNNDPLNTYSSQGIGDLILFPQYSILHSTNGLYQKELTIGLGYKIPLGSYGDSTAFIEPFSGQTYYVVKPTSVQLSSGAQDIIFYWFYKHSSVERKLSFFANAYYIRKGWNPNGEKLGDFTSVAIMASKSLTQALTLTLQARYEAVQQMRINEAVFLYGKPTNYYPEATGYRKVFITPQIGITEGRFSAFISTDFPLYQYLNTSPYYTQVGSEFQATLGLSYKFFTGTKSAESIIELGN